MLRWLKTVVVSEGILGHPYAADQPGALHSKGRVDDLPAADAMSYVDPVPQVNGVNGGGCYGSVLLDNDLWQSLTAMNGGDVPWVHGCVLDHGHDGDHGAPAYQVDGEPQHWLRWPDAGPARLDRVELSRPGRHSKPPRQPSNQPPSRSSTATGAPAHPFAGVGSPATGSQAEQALWAIAAAIERLADAVAAYLAYLPRDSEDGFDHDRDNDVQ